MVLVTGGSCGIGAAIAKRLAADGATVAITHAKDADAAAVGKAIEQMGGKAISIRADAADAEAVKAAVEKHGKAMLSRHSLPSLPQGQRQRVTRDRPR